MKKAIAMFLALILVGVLSACGAETKTPDVSVNANNEDSNRLQSDPLSPDTGNNSRSQNQEEEEASSRILIAYFSVPEDVSTTDAVAGASVVVRDGIRMGNTEYVANLIQETVGGDLFRIETVENYPLDHDTLVDQAAGEQDAGKRPTLSSHIENLDQYDTIILGYPNWWGDLPMPVYTFLEEYDLSGKKVIPFVTHGGSGFSSTIRTISRMQPGAQVSDNTLSISRNGVADCKDQINEWAKSLGASAHK